VINYEHNTLSQDTCSSLSKATGDLHTQKSPEAENNTLKMKRNPLSQKSTSVQKEQGNSSQKEKVESRASVKKRELTMDMVSDELSTRMDLEHRKKILIELRKTNKFKKFTDE
jgi:hypothetical protein